MRFVVDSSVIAKIFLAESDRDLAKDLIERATNGAVELVAPSLLLYEVNNALISKGMTGQAYDEAISLLMDWARDGYISIVDASEDLLRRAEAIASMDTQGQGHISSFDATFHALALMRGVTFLTSDQTYV
ncbi:MAG: type II toxin-antitoxin system VapC family toxin [Hyphomicrobium sp.]